MQAITDNALKPIVLRTPLGYEYFDYNEIIMLSADGNCTLVYAIERDSPIRVLYNLSIIEKKYCNKTLYRCHKSHIINLMHVEKLILKDHQLQMKRKLVAPLSERCLKLIREMSE